MSGPWRSPTSRGGWCASPAARWPSSSGAGEALTARFAGGLALLVALSLAGDWVARVARIPLPGSVLGMIALTLLIELRVVPVRLVQPAGELLVRHLALLYVPAGVGLMLHVAVVRRDLAAITVAALASLVAVLAVVGVIMQRHGSDE